MVRLNFAIKNLWFTTQLRCMDFLLNCIRISLELYLKQQDQFNGAGAVSYGLNTKTVVVPNSVITKASISTNDDSSTCALLGIACL